MMKQWTVPVARMASLVVFFPVVSALVPSAPSAHRVVVAVAQPKWRVASVPLPLPRVAAMPRMYQLASQGTSLRAAKERPQKYTKRGTLLGLAAPAAFACAAVILVSRLLSSSPLSMSRIAVRARPPKHSHLSLIHI